MPPKCLIESPEDPEEENLEEDDPELDAYLEVSGNLVSFISVHAAI